MPDLRRLSRDVVSQHQEQAAKLISLPASSSLSRVARGALLCLALGTPVEVAEGNFGSVRRTYVHTTQDRAVSPPAQEKMYTDLPCEKVVSMVTGHLPFFAAPEELAGHLDSLAKL